MNPLQALYSIGLCLDRKFTKVHELPHPVISVGNISVGGRAKTPMVIDLCLQLKKEGFFPVVLTRGYARLTKEDVWLLPETLRDLQNISVEKSGDEAVEIFLRAEVPVLVSADRVSQANKYARQFKNSHMVFVLDDGFQHWKIKRDFDLVITNEADKRDGLLPTGLLRESLKALKRASFVLHLDKDLKKEISIQGKEKISADEAYIITTRAGSQQSYVDALNSYLGFPVAHLALQDHLPGMKLKPKLRELPLGHKQLILGMKEAVKLFSPKDLRARGTSPLKLSLREGDFDVFIVDLHLQYDRAALLNSLKEKVLGS